MSVKIYQLDRNFPLWVWLCEKCLAARKAKGWDVKETREPPHDLACDDCTGNLNQGIPF